VLTENTRTAKRPKTVQIAQCHKHLGDYTRFENECLNAPKSPPSQTPCYLPGARDTAQSVQSSSASLLPHLPSAQRLRCDCIVWTSQQYLITVIQTNNFSHDDRLNMVEIEENYMTLSDRKQGKRTFKFKFVQHEINRQRTNHLKIISIVLFLLETCCNKMFSQIQSMLKWIIKLFNNWILCSV